MEKYKYKESDADIDCIDDLATGLEFKWTQRMHKERIKGGLGSIPPPYCKESMPNTSKPRRSTRIRTPNKIYADSSDADYEKKVSTTPRKRTSYVDGGSESTTDNDDIKKDKPPVQLFEESNDVEGKRLFGFNTPKRRTSLLTLLKTPSSMLHTPHKSTPESKKKKSDLNPKTPRHVRNTVKKELSKLMQESSASDFSADDSEFSPNDEDEDDDDDSTEIEDSPDEDEAKDPPQFKRLSVKPSPTETAPRTRQRINNKKIDEYVPESDEYFTAHSNRKIVTSNHTLSSLKNPRLQADALFQLLASMKLSTEHEKAISTLMDDYQRNFNKWLYILNEGFNILLYGLGSKRTLLQSFHQKVLQEQTVLVVNGFFPSLTIKDVLDKICYQILDLTSTPANLHEIVDVIEEEFSEIPDIHMYLIVHNIDGPMLRNDKAQEILSRLAKVPNIHLLASIDHINTPLLWDHAKLSSYNFSWWDVTTMLPYTDETAFENSLLVQNSGELALSSLRSVFQSLTTNARGIYMIIVKNQLKHKGGASTGFDGIPFKDLYWACREAFLVSSDLALRAQLTEFLDHKLVRSKRSADGTECLLIPINQNLLQQFLDEQE